jgi:hypothetical protein
MKIHNFLPEFTDCMKRWEKVPSLEEFLSQYYNHLAPLTDMIFDGPELYEVLTELDWNRYRSSVANLDPVKEYNRVLKHMRSVENIFGQTLRGEVVLFGSFETIDGYARFEKGSHRVFLGVDESYDQGDYLDILMTHELTHVIRESQAEVWTGFGLNPKMTHDEFTESLPVIEHLFSEGFSCAVSEILVPSDRPWDYAYQKSDNMPYLLKHIKTWNERIHLEIQRDQKNNGSDYSSLYRVSQLNPAMPPYSHYYWAWQWTKQLLKERAGGDPKNLVGVCAKDFVEHALAYNL